MRTSSPGFVISTVGEYSAEVFGEVERLDVVHCLFSSTARETEMGIWYLGDQRLRLCRRTKNIFPLKPGQHKFCLGIPR